MATKIWSTFSASIQHQAFKVVKVGSTAQVQPALQEPSLTSQGSSFLAPYPSLTLAGGGLHS